MELYSTRHLGPKPRTEEDISYKLWKAIVALLEKLEQKKLTFLEAYPEGCCDVFVYYLSELIFIN